jgi:hypothetical protein
LGCNTCFGRGDVECGVNYLDCGEVTHGPVAFCHLSSRNPLLQKLPYHEICLLIIHKPLSDHGRTLNMTITTSATDSSCTPSVSPAISVCISTQISTFDLSIETPFVITVILMLHYSHPITFQKTDAQFFMNPLQNPGLEFTNIRNGGTQV